MYEQVARAEKYTNGGAAVLLKRKPIVGPCSMVKKHYPQIEKTW
jgi:hypothetical protein